MAFIMGLFFVGCFVWFLISPILFATMRSRLTDLEKEIAELKSKERGPTNLRQSSQARNSPEQPANIVSPSVARRPILRPRPGFSNHRRVFKPEPDSTPSLQPQITEEKAQEYASDTITPPPELAADVSESVPLPVLEVATDSGIVLTRADETVLESDDRPVLDQPPLVDLHQHRTREDRDEPATVEELLGGMWLSWVGALAVIIGVGFGFKYAVENNWIGPRERVLIGICSGLGCFAGGTFAIRRNYLFLAQSLAGAGLGILYLSLYAAFGWYEILSYEASFVGMILTTTLGLAFAGYFNIQPTAVLGMLGGFLTPAMLWPRHDPLWTLFPYLLMLDLGILLIAGVRRWAGLEILAFCGTLCIWFGWHREFYQEELLAPTAGFMTAFLVLFALLSVWHNVIRKRTARAGDFFLILVTPIAYFAALYSLTFERLPHLQGEFSLGVMLFYALLACLAGIWHPAGTSVIAALAGVASTFLILAPPLELTGHWVTICWIAQAVLLVELGLYFRERSLAWTGLGLLAKVQGILLIYFLGTLADPVHFQTAFVRIQLHLIGRPETPIDAAESWWALINGRSLSYLADVIGFSILAWELSRRRRDSALVESLIPPYPACQAWLNVTIPIVGLSMILLETYVWGVIWQWDKATIASAWTIWTAGLACGLIFWSRVFWSRGIEVVGWLLFALLAGFVVFNTVDALNVATLGAEIPEHRLHALWLINPRGISMSSVCLVSIFAALVYASFPDRDAEASRSQERLTPSQLTRCLGVAAYVMALGLCLLETRVWAAHHDWLVSSTLSACVIWTTLFCFGATLWRVIRRMAWVDTLVQMTFFLSIFLLILNTLVSFGAIGPVMPTSAEGEFSWWLLNPRGIGYLVCVIGCTIAAWLYRNQKPEMVAGPSDAWNLSQLLGVGAYLIGLVSVLLESFAWGYPRGWLLGTLLGASSIWLAVFVIGLAAWSNRSRKSEVDGLLRFITLVLLTTLAFMFVGTLGSLENQRAVEGRAFRVVIEPWFWNPRGIGYLVSVIGCAIAACLYRDRQSETFAPSTGTWRLSQLLGVGAYLIGLVSVIIETCAWGFPHDWLYGTLLGANAIWISVFAVGLAAWSTRYRKPDVDGLLMLVYLTLFLTVALMFVGTLRSLEHSSAVSGRAFRVISELWIWNPRGIGYLVSVIACAFAAWQYRDRQSTTAARSNGAWTMSQILGVGAYLVGLVSIILETWAWGYPHGWLDGTLLGASSIWISVFAVGVAVWCARFRRSGVDGLLGLVNLVLFITLVKMFVGTIASLENQTGVPGRDFRAAIELWCWNPRFATFLAAILAAAISSWLYRDIKVIDHAPGTVEPPDVSGILATAVYMAGIIMFSLEMYTQGTSRGWQTATSLGITLVWTIYAKLTLIIGIYFRSGWIRVFSLGLFVFTVIKVFMFDVWHLETVIRVVAFISLGVALLLVSFLYRRFRDRIRSWMAPESWETIS